MRSLAITLFFVLTYSLGFSQVDTTIQRKWNLECVEGDTLLNDPYCDFCQVNEPYEFWGVKVTSPNNRLLYIRHPYDVQRVGMNYVEIAYDIDNSFFVDHRTTTFSNDTITLLIDSLESCEMEPVDTVSGCTRIDSFYISGDSICIRLDCDTTLFCQDLSQYRDSLSVGGVTIYREYWQEISTDQIAVTVNGGSLPNATRQISVKVEGQKMKEGPPGVGDYTVSSPFINFNYTLEEEDVEVWFIDETGPVEVYREYFVNLSTDNFTVSVNGGVVPVLRQALKIYVEGQKLSEGPLGDYEVSGSTINLKYSLENEDAEAWFIMNTSDVGFLGLFRD